MECHLVWFRNDLRVADNPALHHALQNSDKTIAVYVDCPGQWKHHHRGQRQLQFISKNIDALRSALQQLDIDLHLLECDRFEDVPAVIAEFVSRHNVDTVFANKQIGVDELRRDEAVQAKLDGKVMLFDAECVVPPGRLLNGKGNMYRIFTTFRNAWLKYIQTYGYQVFADPRDGSQVEFDDELDPGLPWQVGEHFAHQQLETFYQQSLADYGELRDYPYINATSSLSPYLAIGVLSPGQCLNRLESHLKFLPLSPGEEAFPWLNELIWRDFYRHLMAAYPRVSMNLPFKPETEDLEWHNDAAMYDAWCNGQTGYPIVDAAMRCLQQTGWMHNRLRMVVASFLVKDLHIDWRWGEHYFMQQLIDADFASNNGGWQWSAGTGSDSVPYFRIMNPTTQGERFDEQGDFVRQWVPELVAVPGEHIHQPHSWLLEHGKRGSYPLPIVDHKHEREICLKRYQSLKERKVA